MNATKTSLRHFSISISTVVVDAYKH